jgi:eukaryotic-like serine/threonine-protein kinase
MTPAQLQTIEEIFHAALDQEPDRVGAFLDTACEGDELLRRKVEALLASHQRAGGFIETSAVGITTRIIENGQADLLAGRTIGHYKISERIGTGGMGDVYLASDITAGRKAALKFLPERFTGDADRLKRFQQEAHAVVGLNHPNILTVYEIGEDHSTHYIASELIEGEALRQRLVRGQMQLSAAVDVAIQVASALAAAHEAGIVHRDIKPENIMLRRDGVVKVLDFGVAALFGDGDRTDPLRRRTSLTGTLPYLSPEQVRGDAIIDTRSDIYSLGVVLYEMLSGRQPFAGRTVMDVLAAIVETEPAPLPAIVPASLRSIVDRALHKNLYERQQTAAEIQALLAEVRLDLMLRDRAERIAG